jgi:hypothetical protein
MATFAEVPWIAKHIELYRTDPEKAHMWDSAEAGGEGMLPTLLITTTGRKSGEPRSIPLIYKAIDGNYVIIASKGGMPNHPIWRRARTTLGRTPRNLSALRGLQGERGGSGDPRRGPRACRIAA